MSMGVRLDIMHAINQLISGESKMEAHSTSMFKLLLRVWQTANYISMI